MEAKIPSTLAAALLSAAVFAQAQQPAAPRPDVLSREFRAEAQKTLKEGGDKAPAKAYAALEKSWKVEGLTRRHIDEAYDEARKALQNVKDAQAQRLALADAILADAESSAGLKNEAWKIRYDALVADKDYAGARKSLEARVKESWMQPEWIRDAWISSAELRYKAGEEDAPGKAFADYEKAWGAPGLSKSSKKRAYDSCGWFFAVTHGNNACKEKLREAILADEGSDLGQRITARRFLVDARNAAKDYPAARAHLDKLFALPGFGAQTNALADAWAASAALRLSEGGDDAAAKAYADYGKAFAVKGLSREHLEKLRLDAVKTLRDKKAPAEAEKIADAILADPATTPKTRYTTLFERAKTFARKDEEKMYATARQAMAVPGEFDRRGVYTWLAGYEWDRGPWKADQDPEMFQKYVRWIDEAVKACPKMGIKPEEAAKLYQDVAWKIMFHQGRPWRDTKLARSYYEKAVKLGAPEKKSVIERIEKMERLEAGLKDFPNREWRKTIDPMYAAREAALDKGRHVHAKDFGWNKDDATKALQAAFDSDASVVIVDNMGSPWEAEPLHIPSNKKVVLRKGAVIEAKKDAYIQAAPLISLKGSTHVFIVGEGDNVLRMRKSDYTSNKELYPKFNDDRHGIVLSGSHFICLRNLMVASTGGDGLCMSGSSSDLRADHVVFEDNYRQGVTLGAGAEKVYFTNCEFNHTWGAEPMAGIDFEPWTEHYHINDVYIEDCKFIGNRIYGIVIANSSYTPFTFFIKNCVFEGNKHSSLSILNRPGVPTLTKLILEDCQFLQPRCNHPIDFIRTIIGNMTFKNCVIRETAGGERIGTVNPISVSLQEGMDSYFVGKTVFDNLRIEGYKGVDAFGFYDQSGGKNAMPLDAFSGTIDFNGEKIDLAKNIADRKLNVKPPAFVKAEVDCAKLTPPPLDTPVDATIPSPHGTDVGLLYYAKKGRPLHFGFFNRITTWTQYSKDRRIRILRPDGRLDYTDNMSYTNDFTSFTYQAPLDGFYKIFVGGTGFWVPGDDGIGGYAYYPLADSGFYRVWRGSFTGFFEVPAGLKEIILQTNGAEVFEVADADGDVVVSADATKGIKTWTIPVSKPGVWRVHIVMGSVRFFAPLTGILADCPANLPRLRGGAAAKEPPKSYTEMPRFDGEPRPYVYAIPDFSLLAPPSLDTAIDAHVPAPRGSGIALLYWTKADRDLTFGFFRRLTKETRADENQEVRVLRPDGKTDVVGRLTTEDEHTAFRYHVDKEGFYMITAPNHKGFWVPSDDKVWGYSYMPSGDNDGFVNIGRNGATGFFDVPEDLESITIDTRNCERFELVDADNTIVATDRDNPNLRTWTIPVAHPGVWRFRLVHGAIRFHAPLTGIFADCPENLPRLRRREP